RWIEKTGARRRFINMAMSQGRVGCANKRCAPGYRLEEHHTQRINIGAGIDSRSLTLLWRHILRGANTSSGACQLPLCTGEHLRDAKVGKNGTACTIHQYVHWLNIAVDDTLFMGVGERTGKLRENSGHL